VQTGQFVCPELQSKGGSSNRNRHRRADRDQAKSFICFILNQLTTIIANVEALLGHDKFALHFVLFIGRAIRFVGLI